MRPSAAPGSDGDGPGPGALRLPHLRPRVLRQDVLDALRKAILDDEIRPGSHLLEAEIAAQMGVSRAPVREAIRQLEQEGLVAFFPHRGAIVIGVPEAEIDAIYELRSVIEARAMAAAVERVTEDDLSRLGAMIEEMREALRRGAVSAIPAIDLGFHGLVVERSGFELLGHIWSSLDGLVRMHSYRDLDRSGGAADASLAEGIESHEALIEALRSGEPHAAAEAGRLHVLHVPAAAARARDTAPD